MFFSVNTFIHVISHLCSLTFSGICRAVVSARSGFLGLEVAGGAGTAAPGTGGPCAQRGPTCRAQGTGHQWGWFMGCWRVVFSTAKLSPVTSEL